MWWHKYPWLMLPTGPLITILWWGSRVQSTNCLWILRSLTNPSSDGEPGKMLVYTFINDNNATKKHIIIYCRVQRTFYQQILLFSLYMQKKPFYTFSITCATEILGKILSLNLSLNKLLYQDISEKLFTFVLVPPPPPFRIPHVQTITSTSKQKVDNLSLLTLSWRKVKDFKIKVNHSW